MTADKILTEIPMKAPFPTTITVKSSGVNVKCSLHLRTRSKEKANDYLSWHNKKYGSDAIKVKRGVWYLVYCW